MSEKRHEKPKAVVLLSGGLDSTTVLAVAKSEGFEPCALILRYGQRHAVEVGCAHRAADAFNVRERLEIEIDLRKIGGSALTGPIKIPKNDAASEIGAGIPATYVPARNLLFLSFAVSWAEVLGASDIYIGVNALDYSGYPDCRPEFIEAFERTVNVGTKAAVEGRPFRIHAPLIHLRKEEIIRKGVSLGVDYSLTHSCYDPDDEGRACGRCDSCLLRRRGFEEAGIPDPTRYGHA